VIVLLIGPSGVKKTSSYRAIAQQFWDCAFERLDGLASRWAALARMISRTFCAASLGGM
jgi:replication-associated recombination protein RarA